MDFLKNSVHWLVVSSADPNDLALTVKGALIAIIPEVLIAANLFHFNVTNADLAALANAIFIAIQAGLTLIGATLAIVGLIRKMYLTVTGRNQFVESLPKPPAA